MCKDHWLWKENLPEEHFSALSTHTKLKDTQVSQDGKMGKVMRYNDPNVVREAMRRVLGIGMSQFLPIWETKKNHAVFESVQDLIVAAERKDIPQLRQGQIIFGTRSAAWMMQYGQERKQYMAEAWLYNLLSPIICYQNCGESRKYPCLHGAVYAGKHAAMKCDYCTDEGKAKCIGHHWVIENIGNFEKEKIGRVTARRLEKAFEEDAKFFVLSPPKDGNNKSTRYILLQRALACIGLEYKFNITAVNCENFVMTLLKLCPEEEPDRLQTGSPEAVIKPSRGHEIDCQNEGCTQEMPKDENGDLTGKQLEALCSGCKERFKILKKNKEFRIDLFKRVAKVPEGVLLSLGYYIDHVSPRQAKNGWFKDMQTDYLKLFKSIKR